MTVRDNQKPKAEVVVLPSGKSLSAAKSFRSQRYSADIKTSGTASLVSIKQHLTYRASLGVRDLSFIEQTYSANVVNELMLSVRKLLNHEFGHLRVHRHHHVFIINHRSMDKLVEGLLRVQFHSCQIPVPIVVDRKKPKDLLEGELSREES